MTPEERQVREARAKANRQAGAQRARDKKLELELSGELKMPSKRSTFMKTAIVRILNMTKEERAAFHPRNGFLEMAKAMICAVLDETDDKDQVKRGELLVKVFREIKETLGERIGSNWKETQEHSKGQPDIICDMPIADTSKLN